MHLRLLPKSGTSPPERGATAVMAVVALAVSLIVGFGVGFGARRQATTTTINLILPSVAVSVSSTSSVPDTTASPDSTLGLGTTAPGTTVADTVPVTEAPPPPVTEPPLPSVSLSTKGALFSAVTDRRLFDAAGGCDSFTATQQSGDSGGCDQFSVGNIEVAWSIDLPANAVDILWRDPAANEPDIWNVALRADHSGMDHDPRVGDVTGDGRSDIVVGRSAGSTLETDVIELDGAVPAVSLHLSLPEGRVRLGAGELHTWRAIEGNNEDLEHIVLSRGNGGWRVTQGETVKARNVGPSQV